MWWTIRELWFCSIKICVHQCVLQQLIYIVICYRLSNSFALRNDKTFLFFYKRLFLKMANLKIKPFWTVICALSFYIIFMHNVNDHVHGLQWLILFHNILNWTGKLAMLQIYRSKWFCNNDFLAILQQCDSVE